jgi:putative ABC transport system permease protein
MMPRSRDFVLLDVRQAIRGLRRDPRFTVFAIVTLALGIGSTVAAYSVLRTVLLAPLPYPAADRLAMIWSDWPARGVHRISNSGGDFRAYQRAATTFEAVAAVGSVIQNLTGGSRPEQVTVGWVSRNFFSVMRVRPMLGRAFGPDEPANSLILGHGIWLRDCAADSAILGRTLQLGGRPFTVVGVLPAGFRLHLAADAGIATAIDVWKPPDETGDPDRWVTPNIQSSQLRLVGRLRAGVTVAQAGSQLHRIAADLRHRYPDHAAAGFDLSVSPLHEEVTGPVRPFLLLLQLAAGLVLLLACVNVGSLLLARGQRREREIRARLTLGARPHQVLLLLLLDSIAVSVAGGVVGIGLAAGVLAAVRSIPLPVIPRFESVGIHSAGVLVALGVSVLAAVLTGSWPAVRASRTRLAEGVGVRGGGGAGIRRGAVIVEVALATMLLAGSAILLRSAWKLQRADPGFAVDDLLTFSLNLPGTRYEAPLGTARFLHRLEDSLDAIPAVHAAGSTWPLPLEGQLWAGNYRTVTTGADEAAPFADFRLASPGLLEAMGMRLVEGRTLRWEDSLAVLVNEALARRNWPGRSALGQSIRLAGDSRALTVVGVVSEVRHPSLRTYASETIYLPLAHASWTDWEVFVTVRSRGSPSSLMPSIRATLQALDPELPIGKVHPMRTYLEDRLAPNRLVGDTVAGFALAGLLLAIVGLYGVISYSIEARRHEIAVRVTLGADPRAIRRLVLRSGAGLIGPGVVLGLGSALLGMGYLSSLVYGIGPRDPGALGAALATVTAAALAAVWIPASRAARSDPATVLRAVG